VTPVTQPPPTEHVTSEPVDAAAASHAREDAAAASHAREDAAGVVPDEVVLDDGVVALRRWAAEDVEALTEIWQDPELARRFGVDLPVTHESIAAYIGGVARRFDEGVQLSLAIVAEGRLVGECDLDHLDRDRPDLGYWLAAPARGRGLATRAAALLLDWAHATLELTAVSVEVEPDNTASIAVARRLGFTPVVGADRFDGDRRLIVYERTMNQ
jgi:RimJ/RimL family protein N-acetyltransferase